MITAAKNKRVLLSCLAHRKRSDILEYEHKNKRRRPSLSLSTAKDDNHPSFYYYYVKRVDALPHCPGPRGMLPCCSCNSHSPLPPSLFTLKSSFSTMAIFGPFLPSITLRDHNTFLIAFTPFYYTFSCVAPPPEINDTQGKYLTCNDFLSFLHPFLSLAQAHTHSHFFLHDQLFAHHHLATLPFPPSFFLPYPSPAPFHSQTSRAIK